MRGLGGVKRDAFSPSCSFSPYSQNASLQYTLTWKEGALWVQLGAAADV